MIGGLLTPENDPAQYFEFVASADGRNVDLFRTYPVPKDAYYTVNGVRQESAINSLTFSAGDTVKIVYGLHKFADFFCRRKNYFHSITAGRVPTVTKNDLIDCFYNCPSLTAIPAGLFDNNTDVTIFNSCFDGCSSLISIPINLFDKHTKANDFRYCFDGCSNLTVVVQIGSTAKYAFTSNFASSTKSTGTVYCRAGSGIYETFRSDTSANVNVMTY